MIQYRAFRTMQWLVERLPRRLGYALAVMMARFAYVFARRARAELERNLQIALPDLDPEPVRSVICLQENSPDRHFVVGPLEPGITVLAGFSGHGFKFAPVIGDVAADLALEGRTARPIEQFEPHRFAKARHA